MLKKIGVQNFRVFKDYTEFEIRPITLLIGPNNSGKSSFTKLLLLLQNGLERLNFDLSSPNLESFENVLTRASPKQEIEIELDNSISILSQKFRTKFLYSRINYYPHLTLSNDEIDLFSLSFNQHERKNIFDSGTCCLNFDIQFFIDLIFSKKFIVAGYLYGPPPGEGDFPEEFYGLSSYNTALKEVEKHVSPPADLNLSNLKENLKTFWNRNGDAYGITAEDWRNQALLKEIETLDEKSYLLFNIFIDKQDVTSKFHNEALEIQIETFRNLTFNLSISDEFVNFSELIKHIFQETPRKFESQFSKKIKRYLKNESLILKPSRLSKLLFSEKLFSHDFHLLEENGYNEELLNYSYFKNTFFETLSKISFNSKDYLGNMFYISPQRGSQKRVLMNKSDNEIDEIIVQYSQLGDHFRKLPFLQNVLNILGIDGELQIQRFENFVSTVSLVNKNQISSLSDLGYGYSQIIPVILKIIIIGTQEDNSNIILEEPEANLHPNLQSKFADILNLTLNEFPDLNFIIETHSEYLIRKLQYLTAKKELQPEQSIIYYFNADKYVSREEPKVKKIEITSTGNLTDTFGPGFYDEATKLKFDLMNINKEQIN